MGVGVRTGGVRVGVAVAVATVVGVRDGVRVGVAVAVAVGENVNVLVGVSEGVNVAVFVGVAPSSFKMVPVAVPRAIVACTGFDRTTVNVSFCSGVVSPAIFTLIIPKVFPAKMVSVPDAAW